MGTITKGKKNHKFSLKQIDAFCKKYNIELLDDGYLKNNYLHNWKCNEHNEVHKRSLDKIKTNNGLKCCCCERKIAANKMELGYIQSRLNLKLLTEKYKNRTQLLKWKCITHNEIFEQSLQNIRNVTQPPCCKRAGRMDKIKQIVDPLGYVLLDEEYIGHIHTWFCTKHNKKHTNRTRYQNFEAGALLKCCAAEKNSGSNHPNYNKNVSDDQRIYDRRSNKNKIWRQKVIKRDNLTCVKCNVSNTKIIAHHLNSYLAYENLRYNPDNGVTLCVPCHNKFHSNFGRGNNTKKQFEAWMS